MKYTWDDEDEDHAAIHRSIAVMILKIGCGVIAASVSLILVFCWSL